MRIARSDADGHPAPFDQRQVGRRGARIGDHLVDLSDIQHLAQRTLSEFRVVHEQHHPRGLLRNNLLDAERGKRRLERAFFRQEPFRREKGNIHEEPPGCFFRRGPAAARAGRIELPPKVEDGVRRVRPSSRHTNAECVTTVSPHTSLARRLARAMQVVLPSRKIVWCGLICRIAARAICSFSAL